MKQKFARILLIAIMVTSPSAGAVSVIDTIDIPSALVHFVAMDDSRDTAYTTTSNNEKSVQVIDGSLVDDGMAGNGVVDTVDLTMQGVSLSDLAVDRPRNRIYVTHPVDPNVGDDEVVVLDGATKAVIDRIVVGDNPQAIAVDESRNLIYVANNASANVTVIDGSLVNDGMDGNEVVDSIPIANGPFDIDVNETTNRIYVTAVGIGTDDVFLINGATRNVDDSVDFQGAGISVAVDESTNRVYVSSGQSGVQSGIGLVVLNGNNLNIIDNIMTVGTAGFPDGIGIDEGQQRIYVVGGSPDFVVVDGTKVDDSMAGNEVVDSIDPLPIGIPHSVAVDPPRNRIYVTGRGDTVAVIGDEAKGGVSGSEVSPVLTCFYECKERTPRTWAEITALVLANLERTSAGVSNVSIIVRGGVVGPAIAVIQPVTLGPRDLDEINICRTLEAAGLEVPDAGQLEVLQRNPVITPGASSRRVYGWVKNVSGSFRKDMNEPFSRRNRVTTIAKTECRLVPSDIEDLTDRLDDTENLPKVTPILVEDTFDPQI